MDHSGLGRGVPSWQHLQKETRENSFCCRKLNVGIRALPYPPPPHRVFPRWGSLYLAASPHTGAGAASLGLSSIPPPNPACSKGCLPPPSQSPEQSGLEGVKHCSAAGEAEFSPAASAASATTAALCSPLPDICPSCLDEAGQNGALCLPVRREWSGCPQLGRGSFGHSEPPVRVFASWVHHAWT